MKDDPLLQIWELNLQHVHNTCFITIRAWYTSKTAEESVLKIMLLISFSQKHCILTGIAKLDIVL